jgi:hypothetical protein
MKTVTDEITFLGSPEERIEALLWAGLFRKHTNPGLREASIYLDEIYDTGLERTSDQLQDAAFSEAEKTELIHWHQYFSEHSHPGLLSLAEWFPQWYQTIDFNGDE